VAVDSSGNVIVADRGNHRIRKVTPGGVVSTLAGSGGNFSDGTGAGASFFYPDGVAVDNSGNVIVADRGNNRIRKVTSGGVVSTLAGSGSGTFADGTGTGASFFGPTGVAVDSSANVIVADRGNNRIRKVTPGGVVSTLAGSGAEAFADGTGAGASFFGPTDVAVDSSGNVIVADTGDNRIRVISDTIISTSSDLLGLPTWALAAAVAGCVAVAIAAALWLFTRLGGRLPCMKPLPIKGVEFSKTRTVFRTPPRVGPSPGEKAALERKLYERQQQVAESLGLSLGAGGM
jgi:ATP-dependent protease HslVU (ClpYQ) peptidase subunit